MSDTRNFIVGLVSQINTATEPESVTNQMVARVMQYFLDELAKQIQGSQIANGAIDSQHFAPNSVDETVIANGSILTDKIDNRQVTGEKIALNSVAGEHIEEDSINTRHIIENAVTWDKLHDGAVIWDKLSQEVKTRITTIERNITSMLGEGATEAIENFQEILGFLEGVTDEQALADLLDTIGGRITTLENNTPTLGNGGKILPQYLPDDVYDVVMCEQWDEDVAIGNSAPNYIDEISYGRCTEGWILPCCICGGSGSCSWKDLC